MVLTFQMNLSAKAKVYRYWPCIVNINFKNVTYVQKYLQIHIQLHLREDLPS